MAKAACSDEEFMALFTKHGGHATAKILGVAPSNVYDRKKRLEKIHDTLLLSPTQHAEKAQVLYPSRIPINLKDGVVIIGSDAHVWPGDLTTAQKAFIHFCKEIQPKVVILNGDIFDGASNSRHPRNGWSKRPTVREEMEAVDAFTHSVYQASKRSEHLWLMGNHDMRFENCLSNNSPQYEGVRGSTFKEHFPAWKFGLSAWINNDVVVKHRFKNGTHATHNNTLWAGKSIITSHLHSLKVTPLADYNGNRYGVDTGTMDELYSPQQEYGEDNPVNHRSGFAVLTFYKSQLLWPELCLVREKNIVEFRGTVTKL